MNFVKHLLYWKMPENAEEKDGHRTEGRDLEQFRHGLMVGEDDLNGLSSLSDSLILRSFKNISRETHTYLWKCLSKLSLVYVWEEMRCGHLVWEEEENGTYGLEERLLLCVRWWAVPRSFLGACGQEACFNVWEQRGMKGKWRLAQVLWQSLPSLCPHAVCSRSPIINHEAICLLL